MDSDSIKKSVIRQVLIEAQTANARTVIENINENCFEACVPKPGSSLSSSEQACVKQCMSKYLAAWNLVEQTLVQRLKQMNQQN